MAIVTILLLSALASSAFAQTIPAEIQTHHDLIPIYGSRPTIHAVRDGEWQAAATWDLDRVPNATDTVYVPSGRYVHGTGQLAALDVVVTGNLTLNNGFDLPVRTVTVLPTGDLKLLGSGAIAIRDLPINTNYDPFQFGHGLLVIDGALTVASSSSRQTWATLAEEIHRGDTQLVLTAPPENWQRGDTLILPDTRQPVEPEDLRAANLCTERVTIQLVNDHVVTLTAPVHHDHLGWHNQQGEVEILPDVGNLTQAIVIGSENPLGTPGHVFLTQHADVEIDGLSLVQMGRTTVKPLDSTTANARGAITHVGTNQIGRYALHLHHLLGRPNNAKPYQFRVNRVAIDGSPKWGIAVHGSHYGVVTNNFIFDCAGSALITEDPLEYGNDLSTNLIVAYRAGSGERITDRAHRNEFGGDHWHNRGGLGLQSAMNRIVGNHIYNTIEGIGMAGFRTSTMWWPTVRGVHVGSKSDPKAQNLHTNPYRYPFLFDTSGNQVWGSWRGIETWTADAYPNEDEKMFPGLTIIHTRHPTDLEDQRETTTYGWRFRGDFSKVTAPSKQGNSNTFAFALKPSYEFGQTHFDADIRGYDVAYRMIHPSFYSRFIGGRMEVATVVYQPLGVLHHSFTSDWTGTWLDIEFASVDGVPFTFMGGWYPKYDINQWLKKNRNDRQYLKRHTYEVLPWRDGRNLNVYHAFQSPDFEMPPITAPDSYGDFPPGIYKNSDLIALGSPIFGAVIPTSAEQLPEFRGFWVATTKRPSLEELKVRFRRQRD